MDNDILCKGKGCNAKKSNILGHDLFDFYVCEICNGNFCVNCMYLFCGLCNIYFTCFWCGKKETLIKCFKCSK